MIAAIINAVGIAIGGTLGTLFRGRISDRFTNTLMAAMGLVIVGLGVQGAVGSNNTLCVVVSLALGAMIGELLHIDRFLDGVGDRIMNLFKGKKFADGQFSEGLITASVLFVTGAMAILGSIEAGINGNYSILITKTVIDTVVAVTMASAMGVGVVFSAHMGGTSHAACGCRITDTRSRGHNRAIGSRRRGVHRHGHQHDRHNRP